MILNLRAALAIPAFLCLITYPGRCLAQEPLVRKESHIVSVSSGIYSCLDLWATTGYVNVQFQPGIRLWILKPQAGALASFKGSFFIYGGLVWPAKPFKWLLVQTGAAAGYYLDGHGIPMGYPLEFRLSLSILYEFRNKMQLGLEAAHISNANLSADNPGTESIGVIFQFPTGR